jgi:hypothetical protein
VRSAAGQVWYWPGTDEVVLILGIRHEEDETGEKFIYFDELNLETGQVWIDTPRSIEDDERWERIA